MSTMVKELTAELRDNAGTSDARALRRASKVPSVVYGGGKKELRIAIDEKTITLDLHSKGFWSKLYDLKIGKETFRVIPTDIQLHPVTDSIQHVDFMHVSADSKLKVHVKLEFSNQDKCMGIKLGGVLNIVKRSIDVLCHPDHIISHINIDTTNFQIGTTIHLNDLQLPAGVEPNYHENITIATLTGRTGDAEAAESAESE